MNTCTWTHVSSNRNIIWIFEVTLVRKRILDLMYSTMKHISGLGLLYCFSNKAFDKNWTRTLRTEKTKEYMIKLTASRQAWSWWDSWLLREEIFFDPDTPLAKAIMVSLVLVSPSTFQNNIKTIVRLKGF